MLEALRARRLLEMGISLSEQGWCDAHGEAPALLLDWLAHVAPVVNEVRAEKQADALAKAREAAARR